MAQAIRPISPYSAYAGDPLFVSLELLSDWGMLSDQQLGLSKKLSSKEVQFEKVHAFKYPLLKEAWDSFVENADESFRNEYQAFLNEHGWWLDDYALYSSLKLKFEGSCWNQWPEAYKKRDAETLVQAKDEVRDQFELERFMQFLFFRQWFRLKNYANQKGVTILGDVPLYVSLDSADVWGNQHLFHLDEEGQPIEIGGVPPDYFSELGQLWGNPVYNWDALAKTDYQWWMARLHFNLHMYNRVRIDHFRGLVAFWSVPADAPNAITGKWIPAHGAQVFENLMSHIEQLPIVAEDLGLITEDVNELRDRFNLPGMKVLQFAFGDDPSNVHLPHNFVGRNVVYTGTHDNDTTLGWLNELSDAEASLLKSYFGKDKSVYFDRLIEWAWQSTAELAIMPLQDVLKLDSSARMNTPGTPTGNWRWRVPKSRLTAKAFRAIQMLNQKYNR
jgi:4-alpha-glucanotransferase